ncbi:hypothetical protein LTR27_007516 [Elasticomyces elasticus]|nr:hypothetical protein LTR27_007516 [Elasticomyces elasticus]
MFKLEKGEDLHFTCYTQTGFQSDYKTTCERIVNDSLQTGRPPASIYLDVVQSISTLLTCVDLQEPNEKYHEIRRNKVDYSGVFRNVWTCGVELLTCYSQPEGWWVELKKEADDLKALVEEYKKQMEAEPWNIRREDGADDETVEESNSALGEERWDGLHSAMPK